MSGPYATCKNCGKRILEGPLSPDRYWYHAKGATVWCDPAEYNAVWRARPELAGRRAEPA